MDAGAPRARVAFEGRGSGGNDVHLVSTVEGEHEWFRFAGDGTAVIGCRTAWEATGGRGGGRVADDGEGSASGRNDRRLEHNPVCSVEAACAGRR